MYNQRLHQQINKDIAPLGLDIAGKDNAFYARLISNATSIHALYHDLYDSHPQGKTCFDRLIQMVSLAYCQRPAVLRRRDVRKLKHDAWYTSNQLVGMSLYVDRFCGNLASLAKMLDYFDELGVSVLHLMPIMKSPPGESDGGYAVSDFRQIDPRFGTMADFKKLQQSMMKRGMYLMLDIVLNHTSRQHEWATKARAGDPFYQGFFYTYPNRQMPDAFEQTMPDVFPESAPGSFTWCEEMQRWVMTVFHEYQWDLNYTNPEVLLAMLELIFFYANLGVDILRIDAPAFIWKQLGTSCQNLPQAHTLLRLIRQCVEVATPGMALLGEAIVAPAQIMEYFGTGLYAGRECHFAYNATQMALQWDMLATADTRVMLAAQHLLLQKPVGASWIAYVRCHDDIGLGYDDAMIAQAGFDPYAHRQFLKEYYTGQYPGSQARGALFGVNPKTNDARISGSLASLCGLEVALENADPILIEQSLSKILLMQAYSMFIGGLPMLFYGDELGYTNDYSYQHDPAKSYDNRWMHRPVMDWQRNEMRHQTESVMHTLFTGIKRLIAIRKRHAPLADNNNLEWITPYNPHIAGFVRRSLNDALFCLFNFSPNTQGIGWHALHEKGCLHSCLYDEVAEKCYATESLEDQLFLPGYGFAVLGKNKLTKPI